jgi:hypothetical protein
MFKGKAGFINHEGKNISDKDYDYYLIVGEDGFSITPTMALLDRIKIDANKLLSIVSL